MLNKKLFSILGFFILSCLPAFAADPHEPVSEYVLMDFEDSVLHDATWRDTLQPAGTAMPYVQGKGDSGLNTLRLAVGQGRNGGNALEVVSESASQGLPGFWVMPAKRGGSNLGGYGGYSLPRGLRANRLEFWVKFPPNFRKANASALPPEYPNSTNTHLGTYQFDPAVSGWDSRLVESSNWHFYHHLFLRHDKAQNDWIKVVLNTTPNHQRSLTGTRPPVNATRPAGNYWELFTRFYFDPTPYFSDPEIAYPFSLFVDDIKLTYVPEPKDVTIDIKNFVSGHPVIIKQAIQKDFPFTLKNNTENPIAGTLALAAHYSLTPKVLNASDGQVVPESIILLAGQTREFILRVVPYSSLTDNSGGYLGVTFVPSSEIRKSDQYSNPSFSDSNVERRWWPTNGAHDAFAYGDHLAFRIGTPPANFAPDSEGGITCVVKQGEPLNGQLFGQDPEGDAMTFSISRQPGQGSISLNPSTGSYAYTTSGPITDFDFFWYKVSDANASSADRVVWIVNGSYTGCGFAPGESPDKIKPSAPLNLRVDQ